MIGINPNYTSIHSNSRKRQTQNNSLTFKQWHSGVFFTNHAEKRCIERNVLPEAVVKVVKNSQNFRLGDNFDTIIHLWKNLKIVTDSSKTRVITVINKSFQ